MKKAHTKKLITILPLVILTCFAVFYWPVFQKLKIQWSLGDNSYCYLIVPLFLYLLWEKRHASSAGKRLGVIGNGKRSKGKDQKSEFRSQKSEVKRQELEKRKEERAKDRNQESEVRMPQTSSEAALKPQTTEGFAFGEFSWSLWGLVPIMLSAMLIIVGELGSVRALMFVGIWGTIVGICIMLYGKRARHLAFPLLILFFIVPLPPFVNQVLTFKLKMAASKLSVWMLRTVGVSVVLEGNIIDIGVDKLQVVDACSGLRYFMPMILMALLVGYFFVKERWQWSALLILIFPLSIFINALRIWLSAMFIVKGHPELARNLFHDFSGWLMFMIAGAVLVAVALLLKRISHRPTQTDTDKTSFFSGGLRRKKGVIASRECLNPNAPNEPNALNAPNAPNQPWTRPVVLTIGLCLLFAGSGWALKKIPSSANLPKRMSFEHFPMKIGDWNGKREYISQEILDQLWADDYVTARYFKDGSSNMIYLLIPFYSYQATNHTAHAPQTCILGGGFSVVDSKSKLVPVSPDRDIKIMTMVMEKGGIRMLGSYFFLQQGRVITSPWMNKFYLIWDGILKHRTDGALVRAEMTVAPGQSMEDAYAQLEEFIIKLWPILPRYIPD